MFMCVVNRFELNIAAIKLAKAISGRVPETRKFINPVILWYSFGFAASSVSSHRGGKQ